MLQPKLIVLQPTPYCNIACSYCYLHNRDDKHVMPLAIIEMIAKKILTKLPRDSVPTIVWHAGEPLAAPISWYQAAYPILQSVAPRGARFAVQTNGIAIDTCWIELFQRTGTSVSVSIDGPERFHDDRRKTRSGGPTWALSMRGLHLLQGAGMAPSVISVLSPQSLDAADEYFAFYRDHGITHVNFNIDEMEGAHHRSSFYGRDHKKRMSAFLLALLKLAYAEGFPLHIREIERVAAILAGLAPIQNEQTDAWGVIVVGARGELSTFSPEGTEVVDRRYANFVFGNVLAGGVSEANRSTAFQRAKADIATGVETCRRSCRYFGVCAGGAPVNKLTETGSLSTGETQFCRLSIQAASDALTEFLWQASSNTYLQPQGQSLSRQGSLARSC